MHLTLSCQLLYGSSGKRLNKLLRKISVYNKFLKINRKNRCELNRFIWVHEKKKNALETLQIFKWGPQRTGMLATNWFDFRDKNHYPHSLTRVSWAENDYNCLLRPEISQRMLLFRSGKPNPSESSH